MARPGLRADLRAALHQAKESGRKVTRERVAVQIDGGVQTISLVVEPITEDKETAYGVVFLDHGPIETRDETGAERRAGEDGAIQQIERELQETKDRLQSTIEELETANEEFRSANEEMLSVNEELQSSNEELETSKEELQSVNEELQTVNSELSYKIDELDRANSDLNNLFQSTQIATVFLDGNLAIRSFTPAVDQAVQSDPDRPRPAADRHRQPDRLPGSRRRHPGGVRRRRAGRAAGQPRRRQEPLSRARPPLSAPTIRSTACC